MESWRTEGWASWARLRGYQIKMFGILSQRKSYLSIIVLFSSLFHNSHDQKALRANTYSNW